MAAKLTPQQSPQAPSSSFWQLISGVAHDLDLMLQDLFPDSIPSPLREEYGLTNDFTLDETFANHPSLLEQFMRGAGDEACPPCSEDSGGEYRSSKSVLPDSPTSDSYDGRTTPTTTTTSSPSPPPPAPPPRTPQYPDYSAHLHCMASSDGGQTGMVSSSSVSSVQEETTDGDSSQSSNSFAPCDIGLLERLIRTHPIWFLPGIGRAGAVHLLQGKDIGNFIVRQSSKPNTMALSVRLPESKGPYVEHYLIETVGDAQLRLEGSDNNFHAIPMLVAHYCQCCDELPVQLCLPRPLAQAGSRQELSSLALLGQDFWLSSLVQNPLSGAPVATFSNPPSENIQNSTFRPITDALGSKRTGPSPPNTLALSSQHQPQTWQDLHQSPSSSSPPPPVAPKYQSRGVPPLPPPRSFPPSKSSSSANVPSSITNADQSSDTSSPTNNNESSTKISPESGKVTDSTKSKSEDFDKKADKKISRAVHYKQSNIVDLPSDYYKSSLADKISDYEDIWGNTLSKEKERKPNFKTFRLPPQSDPCYIDSFKQRNLDFLKQKHTETGHSKFRYTYTKGTQTEVPADQNMPLATSSNVLHSELSDQMHSNAAGITTINVDSQPQNVVTFSDEVLYTEDAEGFSSPFYSEPVDCLPLDGTGSKRISLLSSEIGPLPQRFFNHRFSDPNLHWPQGTPCRKVDTLDEERLASLSSSVDNIKGLGPSPQHRRQQNLSFTTTWVQELQHRISCNSLPKKDGETQVSHNDLCASKPLSKETHSPKKPGSKAQNNTSWPLDSSWEWVAHEDSDDDSPAATLESKFPLHIPAEQSDSHQLSDTTTVEDLIAMRSPELKVPEIRPLTQSNLMRASEYDNLGCPSEPPKDIQKHRSSDIADDAATEFSEPWDSLRWERLLRLVIPETDILGDDDTIQREKRENHKNSVIEKNEKNHFEHEETEEVIRYEDSESVSMVSAFSDVASEGIEDTSVSEYPTMALDRERNRSFQERLEPLLAAQRVVALRKKTTARVGENIRQYIFRLSEERNNTFAMSIENFIQCTKESNETNPTIVMRNIRQFMSGMKNYLVKHGEGQFEQLVQEERSKLKSDEFLNIDAITEGALHKLVIKPLKGFIYQLFVNEYTRNGSLKLLSDNIKFARTKTPEELGVRPEFKPPEGSSLEVVHHFLNRLQQAYSPLKKLENLLAAISTIYNSVQQDKMAQGKDHMSLGADDFLPIFICVLVRCGLIAAEIEADYMWGLLHPSLMSGEGGYYLTTLSSAVHVLKSLQACSPESPTHSQSFSSSSVAGSGIAGSVISKGDASSARGIGLKPSSPEPRLPCIADLQGFMKIMIPDELTGSIISKTLPVRPNMTTKEVGKMIAHKFNVTNPQDYCLFKLVKGEETLLGDNECPQTIKSDLLATGVDCLFAYKRCDAKFIWPVLENS